MTTAHDTAATLEAAIDAHGANASGARAALHRPAPVLGEAVGDGGGGVTDRHGEWSQCERCGYPSQITRSVAFGGFLHWNGEIVLCWNGRECLLRLRRKRRASAQP